MTFEQRIRELEKLALVRVPGTVIQRIQMDNTTLEREGLVPKSRTKRICANCRAPWKGSVASCRCVWMKMAIWTEVDAKDGGAPRVSSHVWAAGIGEMDAPKVFGYGHTIGEALDNAEAKIKKQLKARRAKR